ncbi:MAG: hypothetical protein IJG39_08240 [Synergistaceae bacterium]|nr:hypothetical protein [Synergistaceae bacterium]
MPATNGAKGNNQQLAYDVGEDKTQEGEISTPKKKPRPRAAELKEMQDLIEPEYQPLDNLSPDELMDTVVSTYYEPSFMQPKIETIISHHWDDIFSRTGYNWRVVLRKPDSVIIPLSNGKAFFCRPYPRCRGKYKAVLLNGRGKVIDRLTQELPVTLKEAVNMCEQELRKQCSGAVYNLSRFGGINDGCYHPELHGNFEEYLQEKGICLSDILVKLKALGLSDENIERLKSTSVKHAYYVFNKLENDVALTREQLVKALHLYTDVELLSKRDWPKVERNEPMAVGLIEYASKKTTLFIECVGFHNLTPTDQKALKAEIIDMVNERIQEYLQKTKSKGTSKKSAS